MTDRSKVQQSRIDGLDTALSGKQATLVSGENIKTINNNSILGSGNLTLDGLPSQSGQSGKFLTTDGTDASWANVSATPDNISINNNSSNALQSIGNINKNTATGALAVKYDWVGTLQEYTTQGVKTAHPEWICYIIDDISGGTSVYTKAEVDALILAANPTGTIIPYAGSTAPNGFLLCDGSAVSRTTYSALFSVIGTTYGEGDGNSTFNLPDLEFVLKGIKGNEMTLGLTNGTNNGGLQSMAFASGITQNGELEINHVVYGLSIGSTGSQADSLFGSNKGIGITTDSSKSGIESETNSNINYVIKY